MSKKRKSKFIQQQRYNESVNRKFANAGERRLRQFNRTVENYQTETKELAEDSLRQLKDAGLLEGVNIDEINMHSKLFKISFLRSNINKTKANLGNDIEKIKILDETLEDIESLVTFKIFEGYKCENKIEDLQSVVESVLNLEIVKNEETKINFEHFDNDIETFITGEKRDLFELIFFSFVKDNIDKHYFFVSQFVSIIENTDPSDEYVKILANNIINLVDNYIGEGDDNNEVQISE